MAEKKPPARSTSDRATKQATTKRAAAKPGAATTKAGATTARTTPASTRARKSAASSPTTAARSTSRAAAGSGKTAARSATASQKPAPKKSDPKTAPKSGHFEKARTRAERLLRDPDAVERLANEAEAKAAKKKAGKLSAVLDDVRALIRLVRAYARGDYRAIAWESMVLVVAALVYLVSPIDVIPDFLPGGLADDAVIVAFVVGMVRDEIDDFRNWETQQTDRK